MRRCGFMQTLPWEARLDGDVWTIGQPAVANGKRLWFEVARITNPPRDAQVMAEMLVRAVNLWRAAGAEDGDADNADDPNYGVPR
jgi:hypothetical protein